MFNTEKAIVLHELNGDTRFNIEYSIVDGEAHCDIAFEDGRPTITFEEFYKHNFICKYCGEAYSNDIEHVEVGETGAYACASCRDLHLATCDECGHWYPRDQINETSDTHRHLCNDCCSNLDVVWCSDCNSCFEETELEWDDDADGYICERCYNRRYHSVIKRYHTMKNGGCYKYYDTKLDENDKNLREIRSSNLFMGFELEVDDPTGKVDVEDVATKTSNEFFGTICKFEHDGSLGNGFEIISNPMTYRYVMENRGKFEKALSDLSSRGMRSHDTNTCGLHIHIDREFFGQDDFEIKIAEAKLLYLMSKFWKDFVIFSRRVCNFHYCRRYDIEGADNKANYIRNILRDERHSNLDRYRALNLTNYNTIEFRIFKGTIRPSTFFAVLEFVDSIANFVKDNTFAAVCKIRFEDLLEGTRYALPYYANCLDGECQSM